MNELKRQVVRGLYKEAGVSAILKGIKDAAIKTKDFAVNTYKKNPEAWKRAGKDAIGAVTFMGLGKAKDAIQGKKTSLLDYLLYGGAGVAGAEAWQYVDRRKEQNTDLTNKLGDTESKLQKLKEENNKLVSDIADKDASIADKDATINEQKEVISNFQNSGNPDIPLASTEAGAKAHYDALSESEKRNAILRATMAKMKTDNASAIADLENKIKVSQDTSYKKGVNNTLRRIDDSERLTNESRKMEKSRSSEVAGEAVKGFVNKLMTLGDYWKK